MIIIIIGIVLIAFLLAIVVCLSLDFGLAGFIIIFVVICAVFAPVQTTHTDVNDYEIKSITSSNSYYSVIYEDDGVFKIEIIYENDVDLSMTEGNSTIHIEKKYYQSLTGIVYLEEEATIYMNYG